MKYVKQFGIVLLISLIGEALNAWIPLPVPASIYGIVLRFLCLEFKIIPLAAVKETGAFLVELMPLMFVPAAVGLLGVWDLVRAQWLQYAVITVVTTFLVMLAAGWITQAVIRRDQKSEVDRDA